MIDERKALKLVEDVARASDALERAQSEEREAGQRAADAKRSLEMAKTALNQFLGVK